tara:strand:+ start:1490 stop:1858 length:369 start_codon:yes stop_codon:yes gene_type:complete
MAKLNTTLSINSTTVSTNALSLNVSDVLAVTNPVTGLSRESVAINADTVIVANSVSSSVYVYLKNIDTGNLVYLKTDAQGETPFARLHAQEAILFCVAPSTGLHLRADTGACIVEYATFTKE